MSSDELTPGAMQVTLGRTLPSGARVAFESAPAGWLTKDGKVRRSDWRCYRYHAPDAEKPVRLPSVTSICGDVLPKPGLPPWAEKHGILGAVEAVRRGLITPDMAPDEIVRAVRHNRLGADAARDDAADRGLNVHGLLERYMLTGQAPNPALYPEAHRPFIRGLVRWLLATDPEPVAVELLVCDPERGYAGRADLIARIRGRLTLMDAKTNPNGAIFDSAHLQVTLLREAEQRHGEHAIEDLLLVSFDGQGGYREMDCVASVDLAERALAFYRDVKALARACEENNKISRARLEAVA